MALSIYVGKVYRIFMQFARINSMCKSVVLTRDRSYFSNIALKKKKDYTLKAFCLNEIILKLHNIAK